MNNKSTRLTLTLISIFVGFIGGGGFVNETSIQTGCALLLIMWANNISNLNK